MDEANPHSLVDAPRRDVLTVVGRVDARQRVVRRALTADWVRRVAYNAVVDRRVPFAEGLAYRLASSEARCERRAPPLEPARSTAFLPVPRMRDVEPALARLREAHPVLAEFPYSVLSRAAEDACAAVAAHVTRCVEAKLAGRPMPKLRFRSAGDPMDVVTDAFRIRRSGDGAGTTRSKVGERVTATTLRNRRRRDKDKRERDEAYRTEKRRNGWDEERIDAALARRAARADRDRARNAGKLKESRNGCPRRDSPEAIVGERVVDLEVKGIGRMRVRLDREKPPGCEVVRVHLVKETRRSARPEVRLVLSVPRPVPIHDELATGASIHAAVRHLPADASPLDAVEAVLAAGIPVRGEDLGLASASTDDRGRTTKLRRISKDELRRMAAHQRALAHKDRCARLAAEAKAVANAKDVVGTKEATQGDPKQQSKPKPRRPRRSNRARKVQDRIACQGKRARNRQRTAALTDAKRLVQDVRLVATDPVRMARPLLGKGGPAERREAKAAGRPAPAGPVVAVRADGSTVTLDASRQRSMRRNMHSLAPAFRVRRVGLLCERVGTIHATPGHEGTTSRCPRCRSVRKKALGEREHACAACGLRMPLDRAGALYTLGSALLGFRAGPDPGGRVAARREARARADAKADAERERRAAMGRKGGAERGAARKAGKARAVALGDDRAYDPGPLKRGGTSGGTARVQAPVVSDRDTTTKLYFRPCRRRFRDGP